MLNLINFAHILNLIPANCRSIELQCIGNCYEQNKMYIQYVFTVGGNQNEKCAILWLIIGKQLMGKQPSRQ